MLSNKKTGSVSTSGFLTKPKQKSPSTSAAYKHKFLYDYHQSPTSSSHPTEAGRIFIPRITQGLNVLPVALARIASTTAIKSIFLFII
ncbi:MAG: hypothetical protein GDA51_04985 [Ekhidna sp.]|nr:hypothetical protein [Ekhidna sp.]MBC6425820.1 hypothetical protein [Ekhidna sp.]